MPADPARDAARDRAVEAALLPMVASLGGWGVEEAHWLPDRDGEPVIWLRTATAIQRVALQAQVWLLPQVQVTLTRLGVPYQTVRSVRIEFTSTEDERRLFEG